MNKHEIKKRYLFSVGLVGLVSRKTQIPLNFALLRVKIPFVFLESTENDKALIKAHAGTMLLTGISRGTCTSACA